MIQGSAADERRNLLPFDFDAAAIDTRTIRVGPTGMEAEPVRTMSDDVNRDNRPDLLMLVRVQDLRLKCGDKLIRITAKTKSQADIERSERVVLEGCPP